MAWKPVLLGRSASLDCSQGHPAALCLQAQGQQLGRGRCEMTRPHGLEPWWASVAGSYLRTSLPPSDHSHLGVSDPCPCPAEPPQGRHLSPPLPHGAACSGFPPPNTFLSVVGDGTQQRRL